MSALPVKRVMVSQPEMLTEDGTLGDAVKIMADRNISCLVIVNERSPVGIITERDVTRLFAKALSDGCNNNTPIGNVMTTDPVCVDEDMNLHDALVISRGRKIRHLPVLNVQSELVGVISQSSLLDAYSQLLDQQAELETDIEQLKVLSLVDPLLEIGNRRAMEVELNFTQAEALRHGKTFAVALFDIDFFKKYNDAYGHQQGDIALRKVADAVKQSVRTSDRVFRYGGEEILVLMPETDLSAATECAERVRRTVEKQGIKHDQTPFNVLTVSVGVTFAKDGHWKDAVRLADQALYQSKKHGRNRTTTGNTA